MNRSASEWAFQQFIREEVDKNGKEEEEDEDLKKKNGMKSFNGFSENDDDDNNVPVDVEEYQAFLKNKLNLACAAVAMSRVSFFFFFCV